MDRARSLTIAGIALGAAATLGLILLWLQSQGEEPVVLPEERVAAPTAPSQTPIERPAPADDRDAFPRDPDPAPSAIADADPSQADDRPGPAPADRDRAEIEPGPGAPVDLQRPRDPVRMAPPVAGPDIVFCFPDVIPTPDSCADRTTVLALADEPIGVMGSDGTTDPLTVELVSPDSSEAPRTASTCEQYLSLKANGWGAMTTAGMRRSLVMNRFCGLIVMAERATPGRGGLERLTEERLKAIPDGAWPTIGEAVVENPIVLDTPGDPRAWFVQADRVEFTIRDVASADFDGDGENEVLVHTAMQAADGTAVAGGYSLAERQGDAVRLTPADLY